MPVGIPAIESRASEQHGSGCPAPTEWVGRVLGGRWTIVRLLGSGGTASVYEAAHRNGRRVAVKVLHRELASNSVVRRRFQSEGHAANQVPHPNVVAVLDDGEEPDGSAYLVMELLQGRSLAARLSEGSPLETEVVASVAMAVLDVLAVAHEHGVVHRDVKPANIFETLGGQIKLLDFGAARVTSLTTSSAITQSGATVGTPAFMAPEQAAGRLEEVDALTDIWAVGATMFQLLTGRLVHGAAPGNGALIAAATLPAPKLRSVVGSVSLPLARVVDIALAFQPAQRWPNARAMRQALEQACPGAAADPFPPASGLDTNSELEPYRSPESPSRVGRWARFAALMALGLIPADVFAGRHAFPSITPGAAPSTARGAMPPAIDEKALPTSAPVVPVAAPTLSAVAPATGLVVSRVRPVSANPPVKPGAAARPVAAPLEAEEALLDRRK